MITLEHLWIVPSMLGGAVVRRQEWLEIFSEGGRLTPRPTTGLRSIRRTGLQSTVPSNSANIANAGCHRRSRIDLAQGVCADVRFRARDHHPRTRYVSRLQILNNPGAVGV
jgi:hypothetical protein